MDPNQNPYGQPVPPSASPNQFNQSGESPQVAPPQAAYQQPSSPQQNPYGNNLGYVPQQGVPYAPYGSPPQTAQPYYGGAAPGPVQNTQIPKPLIRNAVMYHMGPMSIKKRLAHIIVLLMLGASFLAGIILLAGLIREPGKYKDLQVVSVESTGSLTDGKYILEIPKEFVVSQRDADSVRYVHPASDKPDAEILATVSATAVYAGENNIAELKSELTKQAVEQKGAVYEGFVVDHIKAVLSDLEGELVAESFSEGTTENQKPTLYASFNFKKQDGLQYSGQILVVYGEKHLYILTAVAKKDKWKSNEAVWDQVFKSFMVDNQPAG